MVFLYELFSAVQPFFFNILDLPKSQLNLALQPLLTANLFAFTDVFWLFED